MSHVAGQFPDLKVRLTSAIVLVGVGAGALWAGGPAVLVLLAGVAGLMIWELMRMLSPELGRGGVALISVIAAGSVALNSISPVLVGFASLMVTPVAGLFFLGRDRGLFLGYGLAILLAVAGLFHVREVSLTLTAWLVLVVIAADVGGYCFGRLIGGAKIFPAISPKKTWSGTLGGLALAAGVGGLFVVMTPASVGLVIISILTAAASQAGDVIESAIKRHCAVKDSSKLIPGHGGFLDRFDALITASLFVQLVILITGSPDLGLG